MVYIGMARYISHVRCINNALELAAKRLAERQNPTDNAHGPFASHRNALRVVTNLRLSKREIAHMRNLNFRLQVSEFVSQTFMKLVAMYCVKALSVSHVLLFPTCISKGYSCNQSRCTFWPTNHSYSFLLGLSFVDYRRTFVIA